jgi:hypothetical protein
MPFEPHWFHIVLTTYGAWLDGDERGFRTRHHREHVEGDYKNPPPKALYAARRQRSKDALKQPPVVLNDRFREVAAIALRDRFEQDGAVVECVAMAGQHAHLLVRLPDDDARHRSGIAKRHVTFVLHEQGWAGKLWGVRSKAVTVQTRAHWVNARRYVVAHSDEGAFVWVRPDDGAPA